MMSDVNSDTRTRQRGAHSTIPLSLHQPQSAVVILTGADDAMDKNTVRADGIQDAVAFPRTAADTVVFIAGYKREGAGRASQAIGGFTQFDDERHRPNWIVAGDMVPDPTKIAGCERR